ncbi:MAG: glycosyltransferase involved in cell wall biosynthesis [Ilumatobacter sp.]
MPQQGSSAASSIDFVDPHLFVRGRIGIEPIRPFAFWRTHRGIGFAVAPRIAGGRSPLDVSAWAQAKTGQPLARRHLEFMPTTKIEGRIAEIDTLCSVRIESGGLSTAALVNHFNYGRYVGEALDSVAAQTRGVDEIVVIDDGSDPVDVDAVRAASARVGGTLYEQANGGQLTCLQRGVANTSADVVFFLDADDRWSSHYIERVMAIFEKRSDIGFVSTNVGRFAVDGSISVVPQPTRDCGYSQARSLQPGAHCPGTVTSGIAMRREVLDHIFPLPDMPGWTMNADEALIVGSSLVGARKYQIGEPLVEYRAHGENNFHGRPYSASIDRRRGVERARLVELLRAREGLPGSLAHWSHHEFRTIESPSYRDYRDHIRVLADPTMPVYVKLYRRIQLFASYRLGKEL